MQDTIDKLSLSLNNQLIPQQTLTVIHLLTMGYAQLDIIVQLTQLHRLFEHKELTMMH